MNKEFKSIQAMVKDMKQYNSFIGRFYTNEDGAERLTYTFKGNSVSFTGNDIHFERDMVFPFVVGVEANCLNKVIVDESAFYRIDTLLDEDDEEAYLVIEASLVQHKEHQKTCQLTCDQIWDCQTYDRPELIVNSYYDERLIGTVDIIDTSLLGAMTDDQKDNMVKFMESICPYSTDQEKALCILNPDDGLRYLGVYSTLKKEAYPYISDDALLEGYEVEC